MIDLLGVHGSDDAYVVCDGTDLWKLIANALPRFPVALERMLRSQALEGVLLALQLGDGLPLGNRLGHIFPVHFAELRLVVQSLEV